MYRRSDNGPEFIEKVLKRCLVKNGSDNIHIKPGKQWQNGFIETFNSKVRDEFLSMEVFYTLAEAQVKAEIWRREYNGIRPHSNQQPRTPNTGVKSAGLLCRAQLFYYSGSRITRVRCRASKQPDSVKCIATLTLGEYSCFHKIVRYERGDLNHVVPTAKIYYRDSNSSNGPVNGGRPQSIKKNGPVSG
jgi:hypothetical protein